MSFQIRKIDYVDDAHAEKMFGWERDPANIFYCGPCKGPDEKPRYDTWLDLQTSLNKSNAHRFGIYANEEFVGEFNFVFDHPALMKTEPKTAWVGIGIGDQKFRGQGAGTTAMATIEKEARQLGGKRIEFGVFEFNEPAIGFYEKLGYKRIAEIPDFTWWNGKWWQDFRYEKFLDSPE